MLGAGRSCSRPVTSDTTWAHRPRGCPRRRDEAARPSPGALDCFEVMAHTKSRCFEQAPIEVAAGMAERQAEHRAARHGVEQGCALAGEVRQHYQAVRAGRGLPGLGQELLEGRIAGDGAGNHVVSAPEVAIPALQSGSPGPHLR